MPYNHTKVHPNDDIQGYLNSNSLKLIIIGGQHEEAVQKADQIASFPPVGVTRVVIWIKNIEDIGELGGHEAGHENAIGIALSTNNTVSDIILPGQALDHVAIDHAFTKAGLPENNQ